MQVGNLIDDLCIPIDSLLIAAGDLQHIDSLHMDDVRPDRFDDLERRFTETTILDNPLDRVVSRIDPNNIAGDSFLPGINLHFLSSVPTNKMDIAVFLRQRDSFIHSGIRKEA